MFLIESTVALPALLTQASSSLSPISQQQPRSQVLPGHQSSEWCCVPFGHQQQEGVQGEIFECC